MKTRDILQQCRIKPGKKVRLKDFPPDWAGDPDAPKSERKRVAEEVLSESVDQLAKRQELLYASNTWSLLVIVQAMDAAGKDSVVSHVLSGVNPQGCQVYSFKAPSKEELDHTFLWALHEGAPRARANRHLQSLVLRRSVDRARPPQHPGRAESAAGVRAQRHLGRAPRRHQQLREASRATA